MTEELLANNPAKALHHKDRRSGRAAQSESAFRAVVRAGGSSRIRVHDLRHSCATLPYDQGVPLERLQDVLGYSSPTVTKSSYVEATRRVQQDAVDRLGFLFDA
ncbi:tyrosine-type recombinase/integrase [Micromonospora sp. MA102]|uniref:tyrosine-type recombinase/integrase n=1 Tax=Micromonospora sp. MA102 TaxID=2952755 RepID=UPI0034D96A9E